MGISEDIWQLSPDKTLKGYKIALIKAHILLADRPDIRYGLLTISLRIIC